MPSSLTLTASDLARLVQRGLGDRVRTVTCTLGDGDIHLALVGLDASRWLPRVDLDIAVTPLLAVERQEIILRWRVVPSSLTGIIAAPAQHLGVGAKVIDALIERLGWHDAVISRDNESAVIALAKLAQLQRVGISVQAVAVTDVVRVELTAL